MVDFHERQRSSLSEPGVQILTSAQGVVGKALVREVQVFLHSVTDELLLAIGMLHSFLLLYMIICITCEATWRPHSVSDAATL